MAETGIADINTVLSAAGDWAELVSVALVGTDRRPPPGDGLSLGAADGAARTTADPALELLSRAVIAGLARRVGTPPERFEGTLPVAAPPDPRPPLPEPAVRRLRAILDSYPKYLPEWLAAVRAAGYRVPAGFFPPLLDLARTNTLIRADLALVLGPPGRWLAGASGNWRYLLREAREQPDPQDWAGADPDARIAYVAGLFLRDPAAARRLIRQAWPNERVPVKLGLLSLLTTHPDPADLPFVETLINDASKQVRADAILLAGSLQRRHRDSDRPGFAAEIARLLAAHRGIGRELHNFVMSRAGEPWPEDGARLLLDSLAGYGGQGDPAPWGGWIAEQLQTAVADNAPVSLRDRVAALVAGQAVAALDGAPTRIDFAAMLTLLDFRRDMLAELAEPDRQD
jgi:hypothetical protein